MKKCLAALLAAVLLLTLTACGKKEETPAMDPTPEAAQELALTFIRAYGLRDMLTYMPCYLYDARQRWEDQELEGHGTEEAFCAVVQQQADEKGLSVEINSFEDYLRERYNNNLVNMQEKYGDYTVSVEATASTAMNEETLTTLCANLQGGIYSDYIAEGLVDKITSGYTLEVTFRVDGTKTSLNESYNVSVVYCDGQWKVASHST